MLITYPSCADALAQAQAAGRLHLRLREVWVGGEQLTEAQRTHVRAAFGARLRNSYGASGVMRWPGNVRRAGCT